MNPRTVLLALVLCIATLAAALVTYEGVSHAATPQPKPTHGIGTAVSTGVIKSSDIQWPQSPCNLANRMNIAVIDGLMFECVCSRLQVNYECSWWIVAGVTSAKSKRIKRRHGHVTRIYTRPAVVA